MVVRRRAWLTREGWYYLAVLAFVIGGAVLRSVNLLVILAGTMMAPLLFNWRLVMASLTGLAVRRELPSQILAGETLTVQIDIANSRWWMSSWLVTVADCLQREEAGVGRQVTGSSKRRMRPRATHVQTLIPHVPAGGRAMGTYRITLHRRGRYRFGPLRISTRFPLGLVRGQMTLPDCGELVVAPRLGRLLPAWISLLDAERVGDERRHPQRGLSEGDYYGLRPWQSGDSLRWIHWRSTAKLARPIVRQFERRTSREVAIVLDPWLPADAGEPEEGSVELAISLTATAINDIVGRGHSRLTVAIAGQEVACASGPASALFCEELLGRLAELRAGGDYQVADALNQALEAAPRGARLIVFSSRGSDDPSLSGGATELTIDPEDLTWIDASSERLDSLFSLSS
jgi:uncharacterized protein (DUF58 family)